MPITSWRLGFDDDEGSGTSTCTGRDEGGSTSAAKNYGKAGTHLLDMLLQSEITSDISIIGQFSDVHTIDSTIFVAKEMGTETPQIFAPRSMIYSAATVRSDLTTYAEKCMFDVFVNLCSLDYVGSEDNVNALRAVTEVCQQILAI